jgi:hypothetical protein
MTTTASNTKQFTRWHMQLFLVTSHAGTESDSGWLQNMSVNSTVQVKVGGGDNRMIGRTASADEKNELRPNRD